MNARTRARARVPVCAMPVASAGSPSRPAIRYVTGRDHVAGDAAWDAAAFVAADGWRCGERGREGGREGGTEGEEGEEMRKREREMDGTGVDGKGASLFLAAMGDDMTEAEAAATAAVDWKALQAPR